MQEIIDLEGFQAYFSDVVSPSDRGMLAAAIYLDLVPVDLGLRFSEFNELESIPNPITNPEFSFRHFIPSYFEPVAYELLNSENLHGVRPNVTEGVPLPPGIHPDDPMLTVGDMYARLYHFGATRYTEWLENGGPGPIDHDLDVMLAAVDQFAQLPGFEGNTVEARMAFAMAVQQALYRARDKAPSEPATFTPYGNLLINNFLPTGVTPPQP